MQAELAHFTSPHKDLRYCPSHMNNKKMTPHILNEKEEKDEAEWFSEVCFWERSEWRSGKGEVFFSQCLLPN